MIVEWMLCTRYMICMFYFFFQAEDGIRDIGVTGVQTCALPIYEAGPLLRRDLDVARGEHEHLVGDALHAAVEGVGEAGGEVDEIGRASCRERVENSVVAVSLKKITSK